MLAELTLETAKQARKIPMHIQMLEVIEEKAPHPPVAQLKEFKHYSWRSLSSFVHGGIHAVNRHGRGFPSDLISDSGTPLEWTTKGRRKSTFGSSQRATGRGKDDGHIHRVRGLLSPCRSNL